MTQQKCCFAATIGCFLLGFGAPRANAQITTLLQDNFESYADQASFQAAWPVVSPQPSGTWSTNQSSSPTHSVQSPAVTTAQGNTVAARNFRTFTPTNPTAGNPLEYSFDFFDSNGAAAAYRQFANLQAGAAPGNGGLISMGLNNNISSTFYMARVLGFDGGSGVSAYFMLNDPGAPARTTGFHNLEVDVSPTQLDFFVDHVHAKTLSGFVLPTASFDRVLLGSGLSNLGNEAYFDNVFVGPPAGVPEPTSLALLGMAGLGLTIRRCRRKA
jgi:hypothetical protein